MEFVLTEPTDTSSAYLDTHLEFFWRKCDVCNLNYDIIGKVETSLDDNRYIFNRVKFIIIIELPKNEKC